ncbi:hypothetical protein BSNK01_27720 [Bacillaceae bacterium]
MLMKEGTWLRKAILAGWLVAGGALLAACGNQAEDAAKNETGRQEQQETAKQEQLQEQTSSHDKHADSDAAAGAQANVKAYKEMIAELNKMQNNEPVDFDKIQQLYANELQQEVNGVSPEWDQAIGAAINAAKNKEIDPNISRQLIDKTIQSYFYQAQKDLHKKIEEALQAGNKEAALAHYDALVVYVDEVLKPTAAKRDEYWKVDMVNQIELGLQKEKEAIENNKPEDVSVYKQIVDKTIYRSHYLAALKYAKEIEENAKKGDLEKAKVEQAEAWGFYQAIKGSLGDGDEKAANELQRLFSIETDVKEVSFDKVNKLFVQAFIGKIKGYHEKVAAELAEGKDGRGHAMEANVFLKDIELALKEFLGEATAKQALADAETWFAAVTAKNGEEAKTASEKVTAVLDQLAAKTAAK